MTPEQEAHVQNIIDFAIEEAIDQVTYLLSLKYQLNALKEKHGIELGEIHDDK